MSIINFMERHMLRCPSKALFHIDCPGCGLQRSIISLMKGDITQSLTLYPATMPIMFLFVFAGLHIIFRFKQGARIIIITQVSVAIIIVTFYIYKIIEHKIFN